MEALSSRPVGAAGLITPRSAPGEPLVDARSLTRRFGAFTAVEDISLTVGAGEVVALLGPNGAGKTTTMQMLAGLLPPTSGRATVAGYDVATFSNAVRTHVGLMVDEPGFYPEMTVEEYLLFVARLYGLSKAQARASADDLLERFGLEAKRRARLDALSRGMRQKTALARALIHHPPVLLLDEPTSALDPLSVRAVHDYIRARRGAGDAIIISTHNLSEAQELADRVAIIAAGRLRAQGTVEQLCRLPDGRERWVVTALHASPDDVLRVIASTPGVEAAALEQAPHGEDGAPRVTAAYTTGNPDETNAVLSASLAHAGIALRSLAPRPRALAEVYLSVMEATTR